MVLMQPMAPRQDALSDPLKGNASLLGARAPELVILMRTTLKLMVEGSLAQSIFARVQLGTQEILKQS